MDKNYKYRAFILPELLGKPTVNYFGSSQGVHSHGMLNGSLLAYPSVFFCMTLNKETLCLRFICHQTSLEIHSHQSIMLFRIVLLQKKKRKENSNCSATATATHYYKCTTSLLFIFKHVRFKYSRKHTTRKWNRI